MKLREASAGFSALNLEKFPQLQGGKA